MIKDKCDSLIEYTKNGNILHCIGDCEKCPIKNYVEEEKNVHIFR